MTLDNSVTFSSFGLSEPVLAALERKGFSAPSSIQTIAIPRLLSDEGHVIVKARTGTGKTAAFGIPLVERITETGKKPRALILTPTRELAIQITREIRSLAGSPVPRICTVYGGASIRTQIKELRDGVEIVAGTPGRVMDLMERKVLDLSAIEWFILDEADEMLDMGFLDDVEKILSETNPGRRVALFSATMPEAILKIVRQHIGKTDILEDTAPADETPLTEQYFMVLRKEDKLEALRRIADSSDEFYGLVFCATKAGADEAARRLLDAGYAAEAIHGDLSQEARERTLRRFRSRLTTMLVATDVAARGIDIERLTHVINWDLPNDRETYVHRIGRTGRAGRKGMAVTFVIPSEMGRITHLSRSMERTLGSSIKRLGVPKVEDIMAAGRKRIITSVCAAAEEQQIAESSADNPDREDKQPAAELARELIETLGPEKAVQALVNLSYGDTLDPSRYRTVSEFAEGPVHGRDRDYTRRWEGSQGSGPRDRNRRGPPVSKHGQSRVYVGVGRRHGASARDVAGLLMRAGGIPGKMVDAIEMKDFCAFATMPEDAAKRAYSFARRDPEHPAIKPASPEKH
ncbi:DEAD/DEAH box helicase [Breznakiella homolactica]|uniref:DEAD/DEAH box helicase n=1 Tax=Breznakiella homolactica TaxID=2798577 RepID=A0A7T7XQ68_9SPIR|nr:DEAD/DEAH box helicase [Breznakiella homolactica]QQO10499.1 DEAD/DEAH box helicase [Breznakiella homolactica]